jgi:hypothetical protein
MWLKVTWPDTLRSVSPTAYPRNLRNGYTRKSTISLMFKKKKCIMNRSAWKSKFPDDFQWKFPTTNLKKRPTFEVPLLRHRRGMLLCKERLKTEKIFMWWQPSDSASSRECISVRACGTGRADLSEKQCQHGESYLGWNAVAMWEQQNKVYN